jgi:trehalose 6-phosphate phosphatase
MPISSERKSSRRHRGPQQPPLFSRAEICLFLDIDGTLVDIAPTPTSVRVDPHIVSVLNVLQAQLCGAIALVSGRPLAVVDELFHPLQLAAAGLHGLERRALAGQVQTLASDRSALEAARIALTRLVTSQPGLLLEDKGIALAVHYRGRPRLAGLVRETMLIVLEGMRPGFELLEGSMVLELKPTSANKGTAVESFMREEPFAARIPVFVGDDITDDYGFAAVRRHNGLTVGVGNRIRAQWQLPDPQAAREWLERLTRTASNRD